MPISSRPKAAMTPPAPPSRGQTEFQRPGNRTPGSLRKKGQQEAVAIPPKKLILSAEQKLAIINQIEDGSLEKDGGLEQVLSKFKKGSRQNLMESFTSSKSESTILRGRFGRSALNQPVAASTFLESPASSSSMVNLNMAFDDNQDVGEGYVLPEYLQKIDALIKVGDEHRKKWLALSKAKTMTEHRSLFPMGPLDHLIETLEKVNSSLDAFMTAETSENLKLFFQSEKPTNGIFCPHESQESFINTFERLSNLLTNIDTYYDTKIEDYNIEKSITAIQEDLNKLDSLLDQQTKEGLQMKELLNTINEITDGQYNTIFNATTVDFASEQDS